MGVIILPRLIGEKIMLREYKIEDLQPIRKWVNDNEIVQYLSNIFIYPHSKNETEKFLNFMFEGNSEMRGFVIAHRDTEDYIGQIDLIKIDLFNRIGTLGVVIGTKENLGKGYGTEAIGLMQEFAFNKLNLHRLQLDVRAFNNRAIASYKKCGFIEEGRTREDFYVKGVYEDTVHMGILKREWELIKNMR